LTVRRECRISRPSHIEMIFKTAERRANVSVAFLGESMRSVRRVLKPVLSAQAEAARFESGSFSTGDWFEPSIDGKQTVSIEAVTDGGLVRGGSVPARAETGMNTGRKQDTIATSGGRLRRGSRGEPRCPASIPTRIAIKTMRPPGGLRPGQSANLS
jgi:hypothetical protein